MRNVLLLSFLTIFGLGLSQSLFGKSIYLDYSNRCMNRFEYIHSELKPDQYFVKYQAYSNNNEKVLLSIGLEDTRIMPSKPQGTLSCGAINFNEEFFQSINKDELEVFVVRPHESGGYIASRVREAEYVNFDGEFMTYSSKRIEFDYQTKTGVNTIKGNKEQYFEVGKEVDCSKGNVLRWFVDNNAENFCDLQMVDRIGAIIYCDWRGNFTDSKMLADYTLMKVNGHVLDAFIAESCAGNGHTITDAMLKNTASYSNYASSNTTSSRVLTSPSFKDETVSVPQEPTVYIEKSVPHVPEVSSYSTEKVSDFAHVPAMEYRPGTKLAKEEMESYSQASEPQLKEGMMLVFDAADTVEKGSPAFHIIQKGETLYSLSRKYGVSLEALAGLNGISDVSKIEIGQKLRLR